MCLGVTFQYAYRGLLLRTSQGTLALEKQGPGQPFYLRALVALLLGFFLILGPLRRLRSGLRAIVKLSALSSRCCGPRQNTESWTPPGSITEPHRRRTAKERASEGERKSKVKTGRE